MNMNMVQQRSNDTINGMIGLNGSNAKMPSVKSLNDETIRYHNLKKINPNLNLITSQSHNNNFSSINSSINNSSVNGLNGSNTFKNLSQQLNSNTSTESVQYPAMQLYDSLMSKANDGRLLLLLNYLSSNHKTKLNHSISSKDNSNNSNNNLNNNNNNNNLNNTTNNNNHHHNHHHHHHQQIVNSSNNNSNNNINNLHVPTNGINRAKIAEAKSRSAEYLKQQQIQKKLTEKLKSCVQQNGTANCCVTNTNNTNTNNNINFKRQKTEPITPEQAIKLYGNKLTKFEQTEILGFPNVYYVGENAKKVNAILGNANNNGHDDKNGRYKLFQYDHVQYR